MTFNFIGRERKRERERERESPPVYECVCVPSPLSHSLHALVISDNDIILRRLYCFPLILITSNGRRRGKAVAHSYTHTHTSHPEHGVPLTTPHSRTTYLYSRTTNSALHPQTHAHTHAPRYAPHTHALQHYTHFHLPPTLHSTPHCTQGLAMDT